MKLVVLPSSAKFNTCEYTSTLPTRIHDIAPNKGINIFLLFLSLLPKIFMKRIKFVAVCYKAGDETSLSALKNRIF